jgi:phosphatidylglycerophosphatase A
MKSETRLEPQPQAAPLWATAIATFFGAGRMRPGPGTWGSAATIVLWWLIGRPLPVAAQPWAALALAALATAVGIPAATQVIRATGIKDPSFVVIDEVAGQMLTLVAAPVQWKSLLLGFILFRGFDILKPPPVRRLEHLPEGTGVVVDDLGAGLYALAVMQIVLHYSHWLR